jgi:hypothetical protein
MALAGRDRVSRYYQERDLNRKYHGVYEQYMSKEEKAWRASALS